LFPELKNEKATRNWHVVRREREKATAAGQAWKGPPA
jgi:hypothetical protein